MNGMTRCSTRVSGAGRRRRRWRVESKERREIGRRCRNYQSAPGLFFADDRLIEMVEWITCNSNCKSLKFCFDYKFERFLLLTLKRLAISTAPTTSFVQRMRCWEGIPLSVGVESRFSHTFLKTAVLKKNYSNQKKTLRTGTSKSHRPMAAVLWQYTPS